MHHRATFFQARIFPRFIALCGPVSLLLVACSLFETQPFYPTPFQTQLMDLLPSPGTPRKFKYEEFLRFQDQGHVQDTLVYSGTMEWGYLGKDSSGAGIRIQRKALTDGTLGRKTDTVQFRLDDGGFAVTAQDFVGGGVLPMARDASDSSNQTWTVLPAHMQLGDQWRWVRGSWTCTHRVLGMDTLEIGGDLIQTWTVGETLAESGTPVSTGTYWFSKDGLVRAEWVWPQIEVTDENANQLGLMVFKRVLRRDA